MQEVWFRPLIWIDYRIAVLFTVVLPLILLVWAFVQRANAILRLLIIYWRVASLLMITVYLMIAGWPISFLSGFFARLLIPVSLWFWVDINDEIDDMLPFRPLKVAITAWRWAVTIYCAVGVLVQLPFLSCAFSQGAIQTPFCSAWLQPALLYKQYFHANDKPPFLGFLGAVGLLFYIGCLGYFVLIRLGKQGRSAMEH